MGLDTSHDCWHGSYGGFKAFRDAVAVAAKEHYDYVPEYEGHPYRAFMGWWDSEPSRDEPGHHPYSHPLDVFFVHSDCEGWIFPSDAEEVADALDDLVGYLSEDWRDRLRQFVAGLRKAADEWEIVEFH